MPCSAHLMRQNPADRPQRGPASPTAWNASRPGSDDPDGTRPASTRLAPAVAAAPQAAAAGDGTAVPRGRRHGPGWLPAVIAALAGLASGGYWLGVPSPWRDEAATVDAAQRRSAGGRGYRARCDDRLLAEGTDRLLGRRRALPGAWLACSRLTRSRSCRASRRLAGQRGQSAGEGTHPIYIDQYSGQGAFSTDE
jgi:hypothetical protein